MPRIAITVTLVDEERRPLTSTNWSPLGYEDLGNPLLSISGDTLVNSAEHNLLERLRTSIDWSLLAFARRERRQIIRSSPQVEVQPNPVVEDYSTYRREYLGAFLSDPEVSERPNPIFQAESSELLGIDSALRSDQVMALICPQTMVEVQTVPRKPKRSRPIKRVSRYQRKPVI